MEGTVIKQEYDWFDKYNLSVSNIAKHLGLSVPKTRAYMFEIDVWSDPEMYGEKRINSICFKRYTKKALDALKKITAQMTIEKVWEKHKNAVMGKR
ncbi:hypothetical protein [Acetomicrobium sp.]|uniref:hypothetical protein n=1 Tax=Acetomicrobium sp. TaxID=1872099 RepID=UPI0028712A1B|nr:hypothetical protein [Acetomicrobium sp.]MDR9769814.1 hypothetical protein [Acetomicrobium sp.]